MASIRDKVVIVTGASSGIGRATALAFAHKGAKVAVTARREDELREVASIIESDGGQALVYPGDISNEVLVNDMVAEVANIFGGMDILINNAGHGIEGSITGVPTEQIQRIFAVNVFGYFYCARAVIPHMVRQGHGHIFNVSSMIVRFPIPFASYYTATKEAIVGWSRSMRTELAGLGIHVSEVYPGMTATEFSPVSRNYLPNAARRIFGRGGQSPEAVTQAIIRATENPTNEVFPFQQGVS